MRRRDRFRSLEIDGKEIGLHVSPLSLFFPSPISSRFPSPSPLPFLALVRGLLEPLVPRVPPVPCVSLRHEYMNAEGVRAVRIYTVRIYADV